MTSFARLLADPASPPVMVFVCTASTSADPVEFPDGIYGMTRDDLVELAGDLAKENPGRMLEGPEDLAERLEDGAGADRWVRLSESFSKWVKKRPPVSTCDLAVF